MTIRIVADEREKNSQIPDLLKNMGVFVDLQQLPVGDYIVSPETIIERKTMNDLINSVYDGRLFIQCSDLVTHYSKPLIIIEGSIEDLDNREKTGEIDSKLIVDKIRVAYDTLTKVALDYRIPILYTPSIYYTSELLIHLASNHPKDKNDGPLLKKIKKTNPLYIQQLYVLTSLPGVGTKLATRLLEKFHTPKNVLNASVAELARVPGLGNSRAEKIKKILDTTISHEFVNDVQTKLIINESNGNDGGNGNNDI